jgi:thiol-disulfide isomerase/thioredoxin
MKKEILLLLLFSFVVSARAQDEIRTLLDHANACSRAGKYAEALADVRQLVAWAKRSPEKLEFQSQMLDFQNFLLLKSGAFREALETALELDELAKKLNPRRSPWNCLKIAEAYLGMNDRENALDWIEKAVYERGFIRRDVFDLTVYDPLRNAPRFVRVIAAIESRLGLNRRAKPFTLQLLDGTSFSLPAQLGHVVLIDFWDVQCPPCRKEMPNLKKLHQEFAGRGLVILGISLDTDKALLHGYLKELAPGWKMACSFQGWSDPTAKLYSINATPSSWLIDRRGILRHVDLRGEALLKAVQALLQSGESQNS